MLRERSLNSCFILDQASFYLWQELCDIVNLVMDDHPEVLRVFVLSNLGQCVDRHFLALTFDINGTPERYDDDGVHDIGDVLHFSAQPRMSSYFFFFGTQLSNVGAKEEVVVKCMFFWNACYANKNKFFQLCFVFLRQRYSKWGMILKIPDFLKRSMLFWELLWWTDLEQIICSKHNMAGMIKCLK